MKRKKKRFLPGEYLIAAVLVAIIIFGVWMSFRFENGKRKSVDGTFACEFSINGSKTNSIKVSYQFDAAKGTYEESWGDRSLMTGSYTVDDDTVTLVSDGNEELQVESETTSFLLKEDILIPQNYIYEGSLPSEDTFDAECTMKDSAGMEYIVHFAKDGTYTYTVKGVTGEESAKIAGNYEREGDFLHRTNEKGAPLTDFYIYDGKLAGIFYTKE